MVQTMSCLYNRSILLKKCLPKSDVFYSSPLPCTFLHVKEISIIIAHVFGVHHPITLKRSGFLCKCFWLFRVQNLFRHIKIGVMENASGFGALFFKTTLYYNNFPFAHIFSFYHFYRFDRTKKYYYHNSEARAIYMERRRRT